MSSVTTLPEGLAQVPKFLEAIGRGGEPVAFTAYGGDGGNWHFDKNPDGTANEVPVTEAVLLALAEHQTGARKRCGHQLGFYPGRGGSKTEQVSNLPCLKAESDNCSKDEQLEVYREFEHTYGVKLTLLDTGGKSIHAYLRVAEPIKTDVYKRVCLAFHEKLREIAEYIGIAFEADEAVARPAQTMRLPGASHRKTGQVATVLQYGEPCTLEDIELDPEAIKSITKFSRMRAALESVCTEGQVLGYVGDKALQILQSIAAAWEKRVPGTGTYNKVFPLVAGLTHLLGPDQAAQVLFASGHKDQAGNNCHQGLLQWCRSFEPRGQKPETIKARLIERAEREYGWQKPRSSCSAIKLIVTEEASNEGEIYQAAQTGGGIFNHNTGKGKSRGVLHAVSDLVDEAQVTAFSEGRQSRLSALVLAPRALLNAQNAELVNGTNVSSKKKPTGMPNVYCACPMSLGKPRSLNGNPELWGDFNSPGDVPGGSPARPTGAGMPAAGYLASDEFRQTMEMLFLSVANEDETSLWSSPKERLEIVRNTFTTIENAVWVYALDAQMGSVDQELLALLRPGSRDVGRVIGHRPEKNGGTFAWTNSKQVWKIKLLDELFSNDRRKPILCIVGGRGNPTESTGRGLSGWGLYNLMITLPFEQTRGSARVLVIDSTNKDGTEQQKVLSGNVDGWDLVICTPVAQSGFSWIEKFHEVGFVVGGETLPPNIVGGQAGRRERTLKHCIAYLPETVIDRSLPFHSYTLEGIIEETREAHLRHQPKLSRLDEIFVLMQAKYAHRRITELTMFTEYALMYAEADGWEVKSLPTPDSSPAPPQADTNATASNEFIAEQWEDLHRGTQRLLLVTQGRMTIQQLAELQRQWVKGGAGMDLISANLDQVAEVLIRSRLIELCDGQRRNRSDELIRHCACVLTEPESIRLINACGPLKVRMGRGSGDKAGAAMTEQNRIRVIGTVVRALGGAGKTTHGAGGARVKWIMPVRQGGDEGLSQDLPIENLD